MTPKNILLCVPHLAGFADLMEQALQKEGFRVISVAKMAQQTRRYPSLGAFIYAKYRKIVHNDRHAAQRAKCQYWQTQIEQELGEQQLDYALFISGHEYSDEFLQFARQRSLNGSVNYQFDGINRYPEIRDKMRYFDRFYAFNPHDVAQYGVQAACNFYFTHLPEPHEIKQQFYFTGTHHPSRQAWINRFADYATQENQQLQFNIIHRANEKAGRKDYPNPHITLCKKPFSFAENIMFAKQSAVLLDFVIDVHTGLSFRTFEALGYRKKLITTNPEVAYYDFYHPHNIHIWDGQNLGGIREFLALPYHELPPHIYEKYRFGNWIRHILNIEPHHKIDLPNTQR